MSKIIVVIGLTGLQGGSVADVFLKEPGWKVRGITRDPSKASEWTAKGVEVVKANTLDKSSLVKAFHGANVVFGVTDFWPPIFNPATKEKLKPGQTVPQYGFEEEKQQGMNIAEAAAETPTLERFIFSTLTNASYWSKGKLTHVYHFDSKAAVAEHIKANMPKLAAKTSELVVACYMSNWSGGINPSKQADGSYRLALPGTGNTPVPQVHPRKDTGYFVRALLQVAPGVTLVGAGSSLTWKEYLKVWCETQNVPYGGYDSLPVDVFANGTPFGADIGLEFAEMFALMDDPGYDGGNPSVIYPKDLGVPCPTTSWEQWCKETDFSKLLSQ